MKKLIGLVALTLSSAAMAAPASQWLTVDSQILAKIRPKLNKSVQSVFSAEGATVVKLTATEVEQLSHVIHHDLHRCGGFIQHESLEEAKAALTSQGDMHFAKRAIFADYSIDQSSTVTPMVAQVAEASIRDMILKLSDFKTRYYKSDTGIKSSEFIRDTWAALAKNRSDVKVELYKHEKWPQASIIMTIPGSERPDEVVIVGGHADSIAGMFGGSGRAPGADDDATGVASFIEGFRILLVNGFKPKRRIDFIGYGI